MTEPTGPPNGEDERVAPFCPVCKAEMALTTEKRDDGTEHEVWACPRSSQHWPPSGTRPWWEGIPPP